MLGEERHKNLPVGSQPFLNIVETGWDNPGMTLLFCLHVEGGEVFIQQNNLYIT